MIKKNLKKIFHHEKSQKIVEVFKWIFKEYIKQQLSLSEQAFQSLKFILYLYFQIFKLHLKSIFNKIVSTFNKICYTMKEFINKIKEFVNKFK